jgi:hypothetical protein
MMTNTDILKEFIKNNNLKFTEGVRNTNCTILCGYSLYVKATLEECKQAINKEDYTAELAQELERVWKSANNNNYGVWWETKSNRDMYKVDELI